MCVWLIRVNAHHKPLKRPKPSDWATRINQNALGICNINVISNAKRYFNLSIYIFMLCEISKWYSSVGQAHICANTLCVCVILFITNCTFSTMLFHFFLFFNLHTRSAHAHSPVLMAFRGSSMRFSIHKICKKIISLYGVFQLFLYLPNLFIVYWIKTS